LKSIVRQIQKKISLVLFFIAITTCVFSQDYIVKNNGDKIACKVLEVATDIVKYKRINNLNGPIYFISKEEVKKIIYENNTEDSFEDYDPKSNPSSSFEANKSFRTNIGNKKFIGFQLGGGLSWVSFQGLVLESSFILPTSSYNLGLMFENKVLNDLLSISFGVGVVKKGYTMDYYLQIVDDDGSFVEELDVLRHESYKYFSIPFKLRLFTNDIKSSRKTSAFFLTTGLQLDVLFKARYKIYDNYSGENLVDDEFNLGFYNKADIGLNLGFGTMKEFNSGKNRFYWELGYVRGLSNMFMSSRTSVERKNSILNFSIGFLFGT